MQNNKLSSKDYFRLLDSDQDNLVSFTDFLAPLLIIIPPQVAIVFISDMRFKMDMCSNLRRAYQTVSKISEAVTTDLIKGKVEERQDGLVPFILQVLGSLKFESEIITENQFMRELAQVEKHALVSFANLTFNTQFPQKENRNHAIIQQIQTAIANVDLTVEAAK